MENLKNIWKPERKCTPQKDRAQTTGTYASQPSVYLNNNLLFYTYSTVYRIQLEAPSPKRIVCEDCPDRPEFYGLEYHGVMGHKEATLLLEGEPNGAFLIRKGNELNDFYTLTWR